MCVSSYVTYTPRSPSINYGYKNKINSGLLWFLGSFTLFSFRFPLLYLFCWAHFTYELYFIFVFIFIYFYIFLFLFIFFAWLWENFSLSFLARDIISVLSFPSVFGFIAVFSCRSGCLSNPCALLRLLFHFPMPFAHFACRFFFSAEINIKNSLPVPSAIFTNFPSAA